MTEIAVSSTPLCELIGDEFEIGYDVPVGVTKVIILPAEGLELLSAPAISGVFSRQGFDHRIYKYKFRAYKVGDYSAPTAVGVDSAGNIVSTNLKSLSSFRFRIVSTKAEQSAYINERISGKKSTSGNNGNAHKTGSKSSTRTEEAEISKMIKEFFGRPSFPVWFKILSGVSLVVICYFIHTAAVGAIKESADKNILKSKDITAVRTYLKKHPEKQSAPEFTDLINTLDDECFAKINEDDSDDIRRQKVEHYLSLFPAGRHHIAAADIQNELNDDADWENAQERDEQAAYESYLFKHPQGVGANSARERIQHIKELLKYETNSLKNGSLPWKSALGENYPASSYLNKVVIKAQSSRDAVVLARNTVTDNIDGHVYVHSQQTAKFYLPNGSYEIIFYEGNGWYPNLKISYQGYNLKGGFLKDDTMDSDKHILVFKGTDYTETMTYTLTPQYNGNVVTQKENFKKEF